MTENEHHAQCHHRSQEKWFPVPGLPPGADSLIALGTHFVSALPFLLLKVRLFKLNTSHQRDFAPNGDALKDDEN